MIEYISRLLAKSLYNDDTEKSSYEEIKILQHGIECIINTLIPLVIIFIYAIFSHRTLDMFIWLFSFLLLRNFIGGYHASSHIRCIVLSSFVHRKNANFSIRVFVGNFLQHIFSSGNQPYLIKCGISCKHLFAEHPSKTR